MNGSCRTGGWNRCRPDAAGGSSSWTRWPGPSSPGAATPSVRSTTCCAPSGLTTLRCAATSWTRALPGPCGWRVLALRRERRRRGPVLLRNGLAAAQQPAQRREPRRVAVPRGHPGVERALGLVVAAAAGSRGALGSRSGKALMTRARSTCASPKLRTPGVSMTHPPSGSSRANAEDEVCRPRPVTALTPPVARPAPGTSALTASTCRRRSVRRTR